MIADSCVCNCPRTSADTCGQGGWTPDAALLPFMEMLHKAGTPFELAMEMARQFVQGLKDAFNQGVAWASSQLRDLSAERRREKDRERKRASRAAEKAAKEETSAPEPVRGPVSDRSLDSYKRERENLPPIRGEEGSLSRDPGAADGDGVPSRSSRVPKNFWPNAAGIAEAESRGFVGTKLEDRVKLFIARNLSRPRRSYDWQAEWIAYLLSGASGAGKRAKGRPRNPQQREMQVMSDVNARKTEPAKPEPTSKPAAPPEQKEPPRAPIRAMFEEPEQPVADDEAIWISRENKTLWTALCINRNEPNMQPDRSGGRYFSAKEVSEAQKISRPCVAA